MDSLSEEEKEAETVNEAKDGFVNSFVAKEAKQLRAEANKQTPYAEDSYEAKIIKVDALVSEEKSLKKEVKLETEKLHSLTKTTIENLSDEKVLELLELKWISPLVESLQKLPNGVINTLTSKLELLSEKYKVTYEEVVKEIHETETSLSEMLGELTGNKFDKQGLEEFQKLLK